MADRIRTVAVALCRAGDRILVERGYDPVRGQHFYRPIGGGVEFGERAAAAVAREWREEFGLTLQAPVLLGVLENQFTFEGRSGHEVVFVFTARVAEPRAYERDEFEAVDTDGARHVAVWVPLDALRSGPTPLRPSGLLELLPHAPGADDVADGATGGIMVEPPPAERPRRSTSTATAGAGRHAAPADTRDDSYPAMHIRTYQPADLDEWLRMRRALWPEIAAVDEARDAAEWLARPDAVVIVAARQPAGTGLAGFAELASRPYADGCDTSPVAFLEGWYVDPDARRRGVGTALVRAGEAWARGQGYRELASDALLENLTSHLAHEALGFAEVERAVRYRKSLGAE